MQTFGRDCSTLCKGSCSIQADGWPEKTRLGLWAVAPKKAGRELSEKEFLKDE